MPHSLNIRRTLVFAGATFALGTVLSIGAALYQRSANKTAAQVAVIQATDQIANEVVERVQLYEYGVRGLRGAIVMAGEGNLTRRSFFNYHRTRNIAKEFPGANTFGFARRVTPADEPAFVARAKLDGKPDFHVRELAPNSGDRYIIQYIEPSDGVSAIGLDLASEPRRRAAADLAMHTGQATLSAPITFIGAQGDAPQSFLVVLPIYRLDMPTDTAAEREQNLFGWTYASLSMSQVISHVRFDTEAFHLVLRDVTAGQEPQVVFHTPGPEEDAHHLGHTVERPILGRQWQVDLSASPYFVASLRQFQPSWTFALGIVTSLLMTALVSVVHMNRERKSLFARRLVEFNHQLEGQVIERTGQLRQANGLLNGVLQSASETAIIATTPTGIVTVFNRGAERILGYSADDVVGKHTPMLFHVESEVVARGEALSVEYGAPITGMQVFMHRANLGGADTREWLYVHKDGHTVPVSLVVTAMRDETGAIIGYLGVAEDITDRIETTVALKNAKAAAEDANVAKSRFLAVMSYELRTPMAGVLGSAELLLGSNLDTAPHQLVQTLMRSAQSLLDLLNDILDFAKIEAGRMVLEETEFSPRAMAEDVRTTIAPLAKGNGNQIEIDVHSNVRAGYRGDGKRYRQILLNLVGNANKFTKAGRVRISVQEVAGAADIGIQTLVADTGIGIAQENCDRLFQPFVQEDASTSRRFGGTGLGLAISKSFAELMGGRIWVNSKLGSGSTFGFVITARTGNGAALAVPAKPDSASQLPKRSLRVLIAEDNDTNRMLACAMLKKLGHTPVGVEHGAAAVAELERHDFDVILMDMQMPVMDGPTAMRVIRSNAGSGARLPIIAMTADAIAANHAAYLAAGATQIATKPVNWSNLNALMLELAGGEGEGTSRLEGATPQGNLLDLELLQEMIAGIGPAEMGGLIESLAREVDKHMIALRDALALRDAPQVQRTAHSLKGLAAQFGAMRLSELARTIEVVGLSGQDVAPLTGAADGVARQSVQALRAWNVAARAGTTSH